MKLMLKSLACAAAIALTAPLALAQETIRVGVLTSYSGMAALGGQMLDMTLNAWQKKYGAVIGDKKIEFVKRDTTGPNPEVAKRLVQELVFREKVQILLGPDFTPNILAVAPMVTEAKVPTFIYGAATSGLSQKSPYYVRSFFTVPQVVQPAAEWAIKQGMKKVMTVVADFGPGIDAEKVFVDTYKKHGLTVMEQVRVPVKNPDFSSYLQRIRSAAPDGVFIYFPFGEMTLQFMRTYQASGLKDTPIKLIASADLVDECCLKAMGDAPLGLVTTGVYSPAHKSAMNKTFVADMNAANPNGLPVSLANVTTWDALELMRAGLLAQKGSKFDADKFMQAIKGKTFESPRGPITIGADGEISQHVYVRRVEKVDGQLMNVEFDTVKDVGG